MLCFKFKIFKIYFFGEGKNWKSGRVTGGGVQGALWRPLASPASPLQCCGHAVPCRRRRRDRHRRRRRRKISRRRRRRPDDEEGRRDRAGKVGVEPGRLPRRRRRSRQT